MLGANGAGKTTTLRAISHTVRTGGEIRFAGRSLGGRSAESIARPRHRARARGPRHCSPELTIVENLRLGAYTRRGSVKDDLDRVLRVLPVDRAGASTSMAGSLSGGEQQMLALAKAFMQRPRLLLLDEPSLGLAPIIVTEIFRIVRELNEEGITVLVVEQNAHIALQLAGTAYVLEVGRSRCTARARSSQRSTSPSAGATWATDGRLRALRPPRHPRHRRPPRQHRRLAAGARAARRRGVFLLVGSLHSPTLRAADRRGPGAGRVFASLALALVLIYRATEVINFAQGEMAMATTYFAYQLTLWGLSYWPAFFLTLGIAFVFGVARAALVIRPVQHSVIAVVIVTDRPVLLIDGARHWIWGADLKFMPAPFGNTVYHVGSVAFSLPGHRDARRHDRLACSLLWLFFQFTKLGLAMRAAALRPAAARARRRARELDARASAGASPPCSARSPGC